MALIAFFFFQAYLVGMVLIFALLWKPQRRLSTLLLGFGCALFYLLINFVFLTDHTVSFWHVFCQIAIVSVLAAVFEVRFHVKGARV